MMETEDIRSSVSFLLLGKGSRGWENGKKINYLWNRNLFYEIYSR